MFIDSTELIVASGDGGAGATSFRREKFVTKGGPDGGDGGRGGDLYFEIDNSCDTLSKLHGIKSIRAQNGKPGEGRKKSGKSGESVVIKVPPGTQVLDKNTKELLLDLTNQEERVKFLEGGKGGLGNFHFRSSTNQKPYYSQPGIKGEEREVVLELKLIADIGIVGFPNVGKSTLISTVSNARPEVANYEFTTLTPSLGVVYMDDFDSFVIADIPGIIEGANEGRGLGFEFLKHIERTKKLLFLIDVTNYRDTKKQFDTLKKELALFSKELETKEYGIALSKCDTIEDGELKKILEEFIGSLDLKATYSESFGANSNYPSYFKEETYLSTNSYLVPKFILPISSVKSFNIGALKNALFHL